MVDDKVVKIKNNRGWNSRLEECAKDIGEKAAGYHWMHSKSSLYYNRRNLILTIITMGIGLLSGTAIFTVANNNDPKVSLPVLIVSGIISYLSAFLSGLQKFMELGEKANDHHTAAGKFSALYHNIQKTLSLYRSERENGSDYMGTVVEEYDTLIMSTPTIPDRILNEFNKTMGSTTLAKPDIAGDIANIIIQTGDGSPAIDGSPSIKKVTIQSNDKNNKFAQLVMDKLKQNKNLETQETSVMQNKPSFVIRTQSQTQSSQQKNNSPFSKGMMNQDSTVSSRNILMTPRNLTDKKVLNRTKSLHLKSLVENLKPQIQPAELVSDCEDISSDSDSDSDANENDVVINIEDPKNKYEIDRYSTSDRKNENNTNN